MTVREYRVLTKDDISTETKIVERIQYLEGFFRNIIRSELKKYVKSQKEKKKNNQGDI